jgi:hypothetical protein
MSEEVPFKSMKITLSEEALDKLSELRQGGAFRSDSAAIEECIRVTRGLIRDVQLQLMTWASNNPGKEIPLEVYRLTMSSILIRLGRFDQNVNSKIRMECPSEGR